MKIASPFSVRLMVLAITIGLSSPSLAQAASCGEILEPKVAQKVCPYLDELKASRSEIDQQSALEIEDSLRLAHEPSADVVQLPSVLPRLFADLTGHNGWQKGKSDGRRILLEDQIFKPLSTPVSQLDLKNAFGRSS
ncbi:MAG: hypothetical protein H7222_00400, partial [Methylotenera sp.]|nr:hypothetical protein [Oligoflexia bacterium]